MLLEAIVLVVAGLWVGVMLLVTFLCKAAKLGDEALEYAQLRTAADDLLSLDSLEQGVREGVALRYPATRAALRYPATGARSPLVIVRTSSSSTTSARSLSI